MTGVACDHVPIRFMSQRLEDWDASVGPYAVALRTAIERIVSGELKSALFSGPFGCGKSLAAAIACNVIAEPLWARVDEAEGEVLDFEHDEAEGEVLDFEQATPHLTYTSDGYKLRDRQRRAEFAANRDCPQWLAVPQILARLRREMNTDKHGALDLVEQASSTFALLVLDDVGVRNTEWSTTVLTEVMAERYDDAKPTIVTSNLTPDELAAAGLGRIVSRLADGGALITVGSASDYRMKQRRSVA